MRTDDDVMRNALRIMSKRHSIDIWCGNSFSSERFSVRDFSQATPLTCVLLSSPVSCPEGQPENGYQAQIQPESQGRAAIGSESYVLWPAILAQRFPSLMVLNQ